MSREPWPGQRLYIFADKRTDAPVTEHWGVYLGGGRVLLNNPNVAWTTVGIEDVEWQPHGGPPDCVISQGRRGFKGPHGYIINEQAGDFAELSYDNLWMVFQTLAHADETFHRIDTNARSPRPGAQVVEVEEMIPGVEGHEWKPSGIDDEDFDRCVRCHAARFRGQA